MKQRKLYKARILIMRTASDIFTPIALMLGIYVILHGTVSPGGGFQGGVIVSSAAILMYLGHGYETDLYQSALWFTEAYLLDNLIYYNTFSHRKLISITRSTSESYSRSSDLSASFCQPCSNAVLRASSASSTERVW